MELGLKELSPRFYSYQTTWNGKAHTSTGSNTVAYVCEKFVLAEFNGNIAADLFMKNRLSFIELAFRQKLEDVEEANTKLPGEIQTALLNSGMRKARGLTVPGDPGEGAKARYASFRKIYDDAVFELNTRMERAGYPLNYHNGFVQITSDQLTGSQIETPFWNLVADPKWHNVDLEMKEAIDIRDGGHKNPEFHAAKALESTIKIISDDSGWTTDNE